MDFSHINFDSINGLIVFFISFFIGVFVYFQNRRNQGNIGFAIFACSIGLWGFFYFIWNHAVTYDLALFWAQVLMASTTFISVGYFHLVIGFLKIFEKYKKLLLASYGFFTLFLIADFVPPLSGLFVKEVSPALHWEYWPKAGPIFYIFFFIWAWYFLFPTFFLIKAHKESDKVKQAQIKHIVSGVLVANIFGLANWFNCFDIEVPIFTAGVSLYSLTIGYAILKHHLFNIKLIVTELLTFAIWGFLLIRIFTQEQTGQQLLSDSLLLLSVVVVGSVLIQVGLREARQKELLDDLNQNLQKKVDEQTQEIREAFEVEKKARKGLEELDKAKNEFILASQHNLRTPITIIKGYIEGIDTSLKGGKEVNLQEYIDKTTGVIDTMTDLVNGLIDVTDLKVGKEGFSKNEK